MRTKTLAVIGAAACLMLVPLTVGAGTAAARGGITCLGSASLGFSPGLRSFAQPTTVTGGYSYAPCTLSTDPAVTSGTNSFRVTLPADCDDLLGASTSRTTIVWNTGATSVLTLATTTTSVSGLLTTTGDGSVTSGLFQGSYARLVGEYLTNPLLCLAPPGVTSQSGRLLLTIVG